MADSSIPGPLCSSRLGPDWIDEGTQYRTRFDPPGPLGSGTAALFTSEIPAFKQAPPAAPIAPAAPAAERPNAPLQKLIDLREAAAKDKRGLMQKAKEAVSDAWASTQRIAQASASDWGNTGIGILKGIGNLPSDIWNLAVLMQKQHSGGPFLAEMLGREALSSHARGEMQRANQLAGAAQYLREGGYVGDIFDLKGDAQKGGSIASMLIPLGAAAKGLATAAKGAGGVRVAQVSKASGAAASPSRIARGAEGTVEQVVSKCRIPDDCIDPKRYPLFMARDVMRALVQSVQSPRSAPC